tara:strand:+ start:262 stop:462 length:201 start_codon:yes stop_codon:yes gene_type:complete
MNTSIHINISIKPTYTLITQNNKLSNINNHLTTQPKKRYKIRSFASKNGAYKLSLIIAFDGEKNGK